MSDKLRGGMSEGNCWPDLSESDLRLEDWQKGPLWVRVRAGGKLGRVCLEKDNIRRKSNFPPKRQRWLMSCLEDTSQCGSELPHQQDWEPVRTADDQALRPAELALGWRACQPFGV